MPNATLSPTTPCVTLWANPKFRLLWRLRSRVVAARRSPNDFVEFCFTDSDGKPLKQGRVHRELQAFLGEQARALVELPRDHGKSVQLCGRILWELGHNPALRVKLVCATDGLAAERSRFLRDTIADNGRLHMVFPTLEPSEPWAAEAFTIRRPAQGIGPSVAAFGLGTGSTGARADLLICDDVVDVRSLHSVAERERTKDVFHNNLMNLLEPHGRFWGLSTPWHASDLNALLKVNPAYALFRRAVGAKLESVWPEKWPPELLAARRAEIGQASFARGYHLVPVADGQTHIRREWLTTFDEEPLREHYDAVLLSVDPAVSEKATADASALVVLGKRASGEIDCLFAAGKRLSTPALVDWIRAVDERYAPDAILFESNAAFAGIRDLFMHRTNFGPRIVSIVQSRSKASRIAAYSVTVETKRFRLRGRQGIIDAGQRELADEMTAFPHGDHDDQLDAAATGTEYLLNQREPRLWT